MSEEILAFKELQQVFSKFIFLIHFDKAYYLYIDLNTFKVFDFIVIMYYILNNLEDSFLDISSVNYVY